MPLLIDQLKVLIFVLICTCFIASCGGDENAAIWIAKKNIAKGFKDPDSVKFSGEFLVKVQNGSASFWSVCGEVNAKSLSGSDLGHRRYVAKFLFMNDGISLESYRLDDGVIPVVGSATKKETSFEHLYWNQFCVDAPHAATYTG